MDDDLEDELMDLATNESAYMPQAAHSSTPQAVSERQLPVSRAIPQETGRRQVAMPAAMLTAMHRQPQQTRERPTPAADSHTHEVSPSESNESDELKEDPLDSGEVAPGWYDQIEMVLANAEARYFAWLEQIESQGSVTEEELRREEEARVQRRSEAVLVLKQWRRTKIIASLQQAVQASSSHSESVTVKGMMQKLTNVVDESSKQLAAMRSRAPWKTLAENLPHVEGDYVARGADEMFLEQLKYKRDAEETNRIIQQHFQALFHKRLPTKNGMSVGRTMNHSLGQLLREFADIFHASYGGQPVLDALASQHHEAVATHVLSLVAADINQVASILVQVLHYKYPSLPRSSSVSVVHRSVMDALFDHLQPTLHALYVAAFTRENEFISRTAQQLRARRLDEFGIRPAFRLDGSYPAQATATMRDTNELYLQSLRSYEPVIHQMNAVFTHRSPWGKAELLAGICRDLDACVKQHYRHQAPGPEINLTADDLSAMLAFVLVAAPTACTHVATQLAILGSFLPSDSALGEDCFAVASLWTAVSHLCHLPH